jgi:hypothetical protein
MFSGFETDRVPSYGWGLWVLVLIAKPQTAKERDDEARMPKRTETVQSQRNGFSICPATQAPEAKAAIGAERG